MGLINMLRGKRAEELASKAATVMESPQEMDRRSFLKIAAAGGAAVIGGATAIGGAAKRAEAAEFRQSGYPVPNLETSTFLPTESGWEDKIPHYKGLDTYVEVWRSTGKAQSAEFRREYGIGKDEQFDFTINRLITDGSAYKVHIIKKNGKVYGLHNREGPNGRYQERASKVEETTLPRWIAAKLKDPITYRPLPDLRGAKYKWTKQLDSFKNIPGKETLVKAYDKTDGTRVLLLEFRNKKVWGFGIKEPGKPIIFYGSNTWDRDYEQCSASPDIKLATYGYKIDKA